MFHHSNVTRRSIAFAVVVAVIIAAGCSPPEPPQQQAHPPKQVVASSAVWLATLNHGDKPGNGYELIVRDGRVTRGTFYLLDPNKPHDLESAGQTAPFDHVKHLEAKVTFSFTLKYGEGKLDLSQTITLLDELAGDVGKKARARIQENGPRRGVAQDLVFIRRK